MNKGKVVLLVVLAASSIVACKTTKKSTETASKPSSSSTSSSAAPTTNSNKMTTASGLQYEIVQKGNGKKPATGDKVVVHYTGKFLNDTVFDSSVKRGQPFSFVLGKGQVIRGWDEGVALLQVGDKAKFTIPANLAYGERGAGGVIPPNATLVFDVELLDVKEAVHAVPFDVTGKPVQKTASGLEYIIVKQGESTIKPAAGQMVEVHYTGYFKDGKIFDSSVERGEPIAFPIGRGNVIKGWDEGIALLSVGTKARLLIPYVLGYGEQGYPGAIPPKSDLIFDVELISVK